MNNLQNHNLVTVVIGGAAGDGARIAGTNLAKLLTSRGLHAFASADYPSLIRGGNNFSRVSFSNERVYNDHSPIDVLVALDMHTVKIHTKNVKNKAIVLANRFTREELETLGDRAYVLPIKDIVKELNAPHITASSVALGALAYILDVPLEITQEKLGQIFAGKKPELNMELAEKGYRFAESQGRKHENNLELSDSSTDMLNASATFSQGMVKAGLDMYIAYPMTPATPILHHLANNQKEYGIKVIHPESELSVINMAIGAAYAGKRTVIGTAGGGFALMHESFSLAGVSETPLVVAIAQRQAPGSGVPTYTSQGDMLFTVFAGHGEFPRIVIAPGDPEEAYYYGADCLNLAWKYQTPVICLTDKHVAESIQSGTLDESKIKKDDGKLVSEPGADYQRYAITDDGISPMAFPGAKDAVIKATSYEHDEDGETTEGAEETKAMQDKRFRKIDAIKADFDNYETIKVYGNKDSKKVVVFWGSTKGSVLEAAKFMHQDAKFVQVVWLEPMNTDKIFEELGDAEVIVDVECNHDAQLSTLIRARTGIDIKLNITRYDARPFEPMTLATELDDLLA